eukprot:144970_1
MSTIMHFTLIWIFFVIYLSSYSYGCNVVSPPRGWNSWISYRGCINETQFVQNAEAVVKYLKPYGYEYVVIDGGWSKSADNDQTIDEYGRPQPSPDKYPHSANGQGFKWLASKIHSMGLKFGVWAGRGITQTAVTANTPIYGTNGKIHAKDIYLSNTSCQNLLEVDPTQNGSQQYINSLYQQFAEWQVDFVKNDCTFGAPGRYAPDQIDLVANAMDYVSKTMNGYEFTYSLSGGDQTLGPSDFANIQHITAESSQYRITRDTWDVWYTNASVYWPGSILKHFNITAQWAMANYIGGKGRDNGYSYPDLDMLPLGYITDEPRDGNKCEPYRWTNLTSSQQIVLMTLWGISRSPLIFGGQVMALDNDTFTRNILTNRYVLDVNYNSTNNQQVKGDYDKNGNPVQVIWAADGIKNDYYVALFNTNITTNNNSVEMSVTFKEIGGDIAKYNECQYVEAWSNHTGTVTNSVIKGNVNANDTLLYYLHSCT